MTINYSLSSFFLCNSFLKLLHLHHLLLFLSLHKFRQTSAYVIISLKNSFSLRVPVLLCQSSFDRFANRLNVFNPLFGNIGLHVFFSMRIFLTSFYFICKILDYWHHFVMNLLSSACSWVYSFRFSKFISKTSCFWLKTLLLTVFSMTDHRQELSSMKLSPPYERQDAPMKPSEGLH